MSENSNTVTVTVDLEKIANGVADYYSEMTEGQIAEMLGDTERAFTQAKKVIGIMAGILEGAIGTDNVLKVNNLVADKQLANASDN